VGPPYFNKFKYKYLKREFIFGFIRNQKVILQFTVKVFIFSKKKIKNTIL
tara:strand:- start:2583 stop:2732 length:150 start_codon:yes stop_codon:yes gene_type:complete